MSWSINPFNPVGSVKSIINDSLRTLNQPFKPIEKWYTKTSTEATKATFSPENHFVVGAGTLATAGLTAARVPDPRAKAVGLAALGAAGMGYATSFAGEFAYHGIRNAIWGN